MKKVAIFFGGKSTEHDISILSANLVINVLKNDFDVVPVYIDKNNDFYTGEMEDIKVFKNFDAKNFKKITFIKNAIYVLKGKKAKFYKNIDIAIPVMHGKNGEDGTLQGLFELMNIPYTQSGVLASALTLDKVYFKMMLNQIEIPNIEGYYVDVGDDYKLNMIVEKLKFPLIVKPSNLGSSIGITKVNNINELDNAIQLGFMFDNRLLIEKCLENFYEYNISVFKINDIIDTSLIEQPLSKKDILTFQDKYKNKCGKGMEGLDRIFPAEIDIHLENKIRSYAIEVYRVLNLSGIVRIDFIYDKENNEVYVNEVNSIPGSMAY